MKANIPPHLQEQLANMSEDKINEILNTKISAVDVAARLKEIEKQLTNPNQITIEGWVCKNEYEDGFARIHTEEPCPSLDEMPITGEQIGIWRSNGNLYIISDDLFPDLKWTDSPKRVKITITPIEE